MKAIFHTARACAGLAIGVSIGITWHASPDGFGMYCAALFTLLCGVVFCEVLYDR